jgi:hypothetical protein
MDEDIALLLDLRLVHRGPAPRFSYAQSCGRDCDLALWRRGTEPASTLETGELESDEVGHLAPAGPCRGCGAITERWRLVRLPEGA